MTIEHWLLIVASAFALLGDFLFDPVLGASDWDMLSLPSLSVNVLAMYLFITLVEPSEKWGRRFGTSVCIVFMLLHSVPWFIINATDRSVKRLADTLTDDPAEYYVGHPPEMVLAIIYSENGLDDEAFKYYKSGYYRHRKDPRMAQNYAGALLKRNEIREAMRILNQTLTTHPYYIPAATTLIALYGDHGQTDLQMKVMHHVYRVFLHAREAVLQRFAHHSNCRRCSLCWHVISQAKRNWLKLKLLRRQRFRSLREISILHIFWHRFGG